MQEVLNGEIERDHGSIKESDGAPTASAAGLAQVDVAVDQAGQSTCRIPIEAPPGVANQTPRLEFV